jgi:hypothetical protein
MYAAPETATVRFDKATKQELHRRLLKRGYVLATVLGDVLAGKDKTPSLASLGLERPGIRPEEALRDALNQVEWRRRLLDSGDDRYGRCDICGVALGEATLEQMAWADRCEGHAARWL